MGNDRRPALRDHEMLAAMFGRHGFAMAETPILQPAEPFIEMSGEDIRRRLFLLADTGGEELCLRPEFTIPAARAFLAEGGRGRSDWAFIGPVFRQRSDGPGEFIQVGLESFGRRDAIEADADMLALAMEAEERLGGAVHAIRIGDVALAAALIASLDLPRSVSRKLRSSGLKTAPETTRNGNGLADYSGVLSALKGAEPGEARAFVKDLLSIAGLKAVGGRTAEEIADRFLEKAEGAGEVLTGEQRQIVERFAAITGSPAEVTGAVEQLARDAGLKLGKPLDDFAARTDRLAARGIDLARISAAAAFQRNPQYYTGFVFEFVSPEIERPAIAGGRYDGLLRRLGASEDIPAVGCAIWLERFGARS